MRKLLDMGGDCIVIAEVAQAHDGSLGTAHAYIDAVAEAGANAVKFQTHIAAAESTLGEPWRVKFSPQDETRYDYWKRMEFTEGQWRGLRDHADECGLYFISSPFSFEAVELLTRVGVAAWKVASGEVTNAPLFERMAETGWPVLLSTGMNTIQEIDDAVAFFTSRDIALGVLQCTSLYPTPPEKLGLNLLYELRERYNCPIGLSDHSGTIFAGLAAAALGASIIEVHVTFSRQSFGPDVSSSVTIEELRQLATGVRFIETARDNPVDKDTTAQDLQEMRRLFTKSIVARYDLPAGTVLEESHLTLKKPGTGMPAAKLPDLLGFTLRRSVQKHQLLAPEDIE